MAIDQINYDFCTGCGSCVKACPADVLRMNEEMKKAVIVYPEDCVMCGWCVVVCCSEAVHLSTVTKTTPLFTSWG